RRVPSTGVPALPRRPAGPRTGTQTMRLSTRVEAQVVVDVPHALHAARHASCGVTLLLGVDEAGELHDAVGGAHLNAGGLGRGIRGERRAHIVSDRAVIGCAAENGPAAVDLQLIVDSANACDASGVVGGFIAHFS